MKSILTFSLATTMIFGFSSCEGWSEKDKTNYIESCQTMKFARDYCDCTLEKAKAKYGSFDEFKNDQVEFAKILLSEDCLSKDVESASEE